MGHGGTSEVSLGAIANSPLQQLNNPQVTIYVGSNKHAYMFQKGLLFSQSPYLAALFSQEQYKNVTNPSTTLQEVERVVSVRSFNMFSQWMCTGRIILAELNSEEEVSVCIEFARLATMFQTTGPEHLMAESIRRVLVSEAPKYTIAGSSPPLRDHNAHLYIVTPHHIESATHLPSTHPVRHVLAQATVESFFASDDPKLFTCIQEVPGFAPDTFAAIKSTSDTIGVNMIGADTHRGCIWRSDIHGPGTFIGGYDSSVSATLMGYGQRLVGFVEPLSGVFMQMRGARQREEQRGGYYVGSPVVGSL